MDLAPELLGLILSLLQKHALKKARLVSKAWEKAAVPYLFDAVFMSRNPVELSTAEAVIDQFGYHLRTLTFSAVYYKAICKTAFRQEVAQQRRLSMKQPSRDLHTGYGYDN
ncbi:hypothetical protein IMSHALPRED_004351 [Imshaugia aleurites]|uniref:F-box domain-containing protein n=1 Tax=Imshaugia aleurites TaxID=172621 RepID=A0A8H3J8L6_9LECA|nr:hypothetical protein IMSHALPRED_004351 [Imshaugia aleurites]